MPIEQTLLSALILIGVVVSVVLLFVFFNLKKCVAYSIKFKWTKDWAIKMNASPFSTYSNRELIQALIYSTIRYLIYSFQYLCLLYFFGFEGYFLATFLGILIVYLLQTGIPLPPSTGLLARGNIALFILGPLSNVGGASIAILASTFSLWIINVVLPSVIGAFFIARLTWGEKEKLEQTVERVHSS